MKNQPSKTIENSALRKVSCVYCKAAQKAEAEHNQKMLNCTAQLKYLTIRLKALEHKISLLTKSEPTKVDQLAKDWQLKLLTKNKN